MKTGTFLSGSNNTKTGIWLPFISGICILLLVATILNAVLDNYAIHIITVIGIYIIAATSLNLTNGYTGLFSLGHAGFMAIGAYTSVFLTYKVSLRAAYNLPTLPPILGGAEFQWPFLPALLVGGLVAAIAALIVGFPVLRLRGHYLAVASLGFMIIVSSLAKGMKGITRGASGIQVITRYTSIWNVYIWVAITIFIIWRLLNSNSGRAMLAIRESEISAQSQGINLMKYKLYSFVIGAFFAGIAGGLYAHFTRAIRPYEFSFTMTFFIVIMPIIGGSRNLYGPALGATLLVLIRYMLKPIEEYFGIYGLVELIYATLLVMVMILRPEGILKEKNQ
jgi:branched-chain amino acid transport system permease protein